MTISTKFQHPDIEALLCAAKQLDNLETPNTDRLSQILEGVTVTPDFLANCCHQPTSDRPYAKTLVLESDTLECGIFRWNRNLPCAIHDHGESWGAVKVLSGLVVNNTYKRDREGAIVKDMKKIYTPGNIIFMPKGTIHSMVSIGQPQLVTVHYYLPKITGMSVYDIDRNTICTMKNNCGAWLPKDIREIVSLKRISL